MGKTILIADDDPGVLEFLHDSLSQAGYSTVEASNGVDALKKARSHSPDLIVLDVNMPQLDGFTVCETLRNQSATARIPILLLTGLSGHLARVAGLGGGANDYIAKPVTPEELISRIERLLRHSADNPARKATPAR